MQVSLGADAHVPAAERLLLCTGLHKAGSFLSDGLSGLNKLMYIKLLKEYLVC